MKNASPFSLVVASRALAVASLLALAACQSAPSDLNMPPVQQDPLVIPSGFPKPVIPATNPLTPDKVELGRYLFYESKLSGDNTKSCSSCHAASTSFSDQGKATSIGIRSGRGSRNAPALMNLAYDTVAFFWDGRAATLEAQATAPITNPIELGSDTNSVIQKLSVSPLYKMMFANAFGDSKITMDRIGKALSSFERTMISGGSDYDRFMAGDSSALSAAAQRGMQTFQSKEVNCVGCHKGVNFTDNQFHSTGLETFYEDQGREMVTQDPRDNGKFRTPSLRNIALTAPYMHNGSFTSLQAVLDHYNEGGKHNSTQDSLIHELHLNQSQMDDLIAFLRSLSDKSFTQRSDFKSPFN